MYVATRCMSRKRTATWVKMYAKLYRNSKTEIVQSLPTRQCDDFCRRRDGRFLPNLAGFLSPLSPKLTAFFGASSAKSSRKFADLFDESSPKLTDFFSTRFSLKLTDFFGASSAKLQDLPKLQDFPVFLMIQNNVALQQRVEDKNANVYRL